MQPLNLRSNLIQGLQRLERDLPYLRLGERPRARYLAFNHELRHYRTSVQRGAGFQACHVGFHADIPSQAIGLLSFQRDIFQYFIAKYPHPKTLSTASELNRYAVICYDCGWFASRFYGCYQAGVFAGARLPETLDQVIPK